MKTGFDECNQVIPRAASLAIRIRSTNGSATYTGAKDISYAVNTRFDYI